MKAQQIIPISEVEESGPATLFRVTWTHRFAVAVVCLICGIVALAMALIAKPIYRADVVITEVREAGLASGGGVMGQLGGLANLAGLGTSLLGNSSTRTAQAVLKSRHLVEEFVRRNSLIPELFRNSPTAPTLWLAVQRFQDGILRISEDQRQGKTTVSVEWTDPQTAAKWANGFVALANELIRAKALEDANRNVAYLKEQVAKTNVVELQRVMYDLIESETKTLMLANARTDYAFTVVDPAVAPEKRISPKRTLMVITGLAIGACVGVALAYILDALQRRRRARPDQP